MIPGKLYSYVGSSKIPVWDGELSEERAFTNCISQVKQNDVLMIIEVMHRKHSVSHVIQVKFLNSDGVVGMISVFGKFAENHFKQIE